MNYFCLPFTYLHWSIFKRILWRDLLYILRVPLCSVLFSGTKMGNPNSFRFSRLQSWLSPLRKTLQFCQDSSIPCHALEIPPESFLWKLWGLSHLLPSSQRSLSFLIQSPKFLCLAFCALYWFSSYSQKLVKFVYCQSVWVMTVQYLSFYLLYITYVIVYTQRSERGHWVPWNWSPRYFWVLGAKHWSSDRVVNILNCWTISPTP